MPSRTELFRHAIAHAGVGGNISDADEDSKNALQCRIHYDTVRRKVLGMGMWPSATKNFKLALLAERVEGVDWAPGAPSPQYRYAYSIPSDLVRPRHLDTFARFDHSLFDDNTKAINTNAVEPVLTYTMDQTNLIMWDAALYNAIGYALGAAICMPLNGKENRRSNLMQMANAEIETARAGAVNTENENYDWIAPWHEARYDFASGGPQQIQYIYPLDTLFQVTNATPSKPIKNDPLRPF